MNRRHLGLLALLLAVAPAAGCWIESIAEETEPVIPSRPPTLEDWQRESRDAGTAGAGVVPGERAPEALALPALEDLPQIAGGSAEPPPALLGLLAGGLRAAVARTDGDLAWIRLTVPNRSLSGSEVALAELTGRAITLSLVGGESLEQLAELVGGRIEVEADFRTTRFTLVVPARFWEPTIAALLTTVQIPPTDPALLAAVRDEVARDMTALYAASPMRAAIERATAFEPRGPAHWISEAQDLTPARVATFHADAYRANGSVIVARIPGADPSAVMGTIQTIAAGWVRGETRFLPDPVPLLPPAQGVFWAEAPGPSEVTVLLDVASTSAPEAAARLIALEVLTSSGTGGRIGDELRRATKHPIRFDTRIESNGVHRRLELSTTVPAELVPAITKAVRSAIRSCTIRPPSLEEKARAAERARLRLALDLREPERWLDEVTRSVVGGARPDVIIDEKGVAPWEGEAPHPWLTVLAALDSPAAIQPGPVFRQWAELDPLVLVVGGSPPESLASAESFKKMPEAFLPTEQREAIQASPAEQAESAREYLERAIAAVGGRQRLAELRGFHAASTTRSGRGPRVDEEVWFHTDGRLRLVRRVLATTIVSSIGSDNAVETSGGESMPLDPEQARRLLEDRRVHPLMLLASHARGDSRYRLVSIRETGDRRLALLERMTDTLHPLRIELDVESGLIRTVVFAEERDTGRVYLRQEYRDYRSVSGGVRVPFHRSTTVDEGAIDLVTEWQSFEPTAPSDDELAGPGGD